MSDDLDVELEDAEAEYLGTFATVEDYFLSQIEHILQPEGLWLLECLHMPSVLLKMEAAGAGCRYRYFVCEGKVFRELVRFGPQ